MLIKTNLLTQKFIFQGFGALIAIPCEKATQEASKTSGICYNILFDLPSPVTSDDFAVREDLTLLAQYASNNPINFSAAGFFNVNFGMLSTVLNSIAAYLVVLLQFNKCN